MDLISSDGKKRYTLPEAEDFMPAWINTNRFLYLAAQAEKPKADEVKKPEPDEGKKFVLFELGKFVVFEVGPDGPRQVATIDPSLMVEAPQ